MIRRIIFVLLIILLLTSTTVLAGDIPEAIMMGDYNDLRALFIGELTAINENSYIIKPSTIMMGKLEETEITVEKFDRYYGTSHSPKVGDIIVALLLEDNKLDSWIFKATSKNYKTLKLVSERYGIVVRYEQYINQGKYFDTPMSPNDTNESNTEDDQSNEDSKVPLSNNIKIPLMGSLIAGSALFIATNKKRRK